MMVHNLQRTVCLWQSLVYSEPLVPVSVIEESGSETKTVRGGWYGLTLVRGTIAVP